jgi:putative ABC transport system permease protein
MEMGSIEMQGILADLRYAVRALAARPGLAVVVVVCLALVMGTATAVFGLLDFVLWTPLPAADPARLVAIAVAERKGEGTSYPDYLDFRDQNRVLSGLAASCLFGATVERPGRGSEREDTVHAWGHLVTGNYFAVLGAGAARGRALREADDQPGTEPVVVLSDGFWRRRLHGDPAVVGRSLRLSGHLFTVVGILPRGFLGAGFPVDLYAAVAQHKSLRMQGRRDPLTDRTLIWFTLTGRMRPGIGIAQARAGLAALAERLHRETPALRPRRQVEVQPGGMAVDPDTRAAILPGVQRLGSFVVLLLLLACANVANLLAGSVLVRERELALRSALGAARGRLLRQQLVESLVLAFAGGGLGLVLGERELRLIESYVTDSIAGLGSWGHDWVRLSLDGRVLGFTFLLCLATGVLSGLLPAWRAASRRDLVAAIKGAPAGEGRSRPGLAGSAGEPRRWRPARRWRSAELLVVLQMALSVWLLAATGHLAGGLWRILHTSPGFAIDRLWVATIFLPDRRPEGVPFEPKAAYQQVSDEVRALPGVSSCSLVWGVPLSGIEHGIDLRLPEHPAANYDVGLAIVGADFFATLGIPLLAGRGFDWRDQAESPAVAAVNAALARRLWPGESPIGKTILVETGGREHPRSSAEIVGLVADTRQAALWKPPQPQLYLPFQQNFRRLMTLVVRGREGDLSLPLLVRRQMRERHPDLAIVDLMSFSEAIDRSLWEQRMGAQGVSLFGIFGLALAALGVGSAMGAAVTRRTHEIGVRMALGARPGGVQWQVQRQALALAAAGGLLGLGATLAFMRLLAGFAAGVDLAPDPLMLAAAAAVLAAVALAATHHPARRAACTDPLRSLQRQ